MKKFLYVILQIKSLFLCELPPHWNKFPRMKKIHFIIPILFFSNQITSQFTKIPDPCFEQSLIWIGIDSDVIVNGQVATSDVKDVTEMLLGYTC